MGLYNIKLDMGKGRISELGYIKAKTTKTGKKRTGYPRTVEQLQKV